MSAEPVFLADNVHLENYVQYVKQHSTHNCHCLNACNRTAGSWNQTVLTKPGTSASVWRFSPQTGHSLKHIWTTAQGPRLLPTRNWKPIPLLLLLLLLLFPTTIGFMPIWYGLWYKGILPLPAIFFANAGCKVKLCCDNFQTTLTAASSGKGVLWQHFHDRSCVYHSVYRIYNRSFVSLRPTDTNIVKFGRKRSVVWEKNEKGHQAETAFVN